MSRYLAPDFFGEAPPPRIIGTETEYDVQPAPGQEAAIEDVDLPDSNAEILSVIETGVARSSYKALSVGGYGDLMLDNGFRVYDDLEFLEASSAEALGPRQAAAADLAGVLVVAEIVEASGVSHGGVYRAAGTSINSVSETCGHHQNFLIPAQLIREPLIDVLASSHMASDVWMGAGILRKRFELMQKVSDLGGALRYGYRGGKVMGRIYIEPGSSTTGHLGWARFERRCADAGLSPTARYLGLAAMSLTLRLVEHADKIDNQSLLEHAFIEPVAAAHRFSRDLTFTATAPTISGRRIGALDYHELLVDCYAHLSEQIELPADEQQAIPLLGELIDELRASNIPDGEYGALPLKLDFAARHLYLSRHFGDDQLHCHNPAAVAASLVWDRVWPAGGARRYWDRLGSPYITAKEVEALARTPPPTRARRRGRLIASLASQGVPAQAFWNIIDLTPEQSIVLDDPYEY